METLTSQDLIYAAHALRVSAGVNDAKAKDPKHGSCQHVFESSAESQRKLADKFERVAERMK